MTGTFINILAILVGSGIGLLFVSRLSAQLKSTVLSGMGIFTSWMTSVRTLNTPVTNISRHNTLRMSKNQRI
jgi:uncharacterized membrane protein YqgA involved in biofilm formation